MSQLSDRKWDIPDTPTMSAPAAGLLFGMNAKQSYKAARTGHLPSIRISEHKVVVPTNAIRRLLLDAGVENVS